MKWRAGRLKRGRRRAVVVAERALLREGVVLKHALNTENENPGELLNHVSKAGSRQRRGYCAA